MNQLAQEIEKLKIENNALILAHYYVEAEVQKVADYVGDSYYLAQKAVSCEQDIICFCGVEFMGESAKILNPTKKVLMPDRMADCPMAHMISVEKIQEMRQQYDDLAVVCYVNSTAQVKAFSDVCVTSSNAVSIVKNLSEKTIFFVPDQNLGRYVATRVPEKQIILNDGFCHVHHRITAQEVQKAKQKRPEAKVLVHPECTMEVLALADYVGSTKGILEYARKSEASCFLICTEMGILHPLQQQNPQKHFYFVGKAQLCPNMKKITLEKVKQVLIHQQNEIILEEALMERARIPLERMLKLAEK